VSKEINLESIVMVFHVIVDCMCQWRSLGYGQTMRTEFVLTMCGDDGSEIHM